MKYALFFIFCLSFSVSLAQKGKVIIEGDERINNLLNKQTKLNKSKDGVSGYRIQLKNTSSQKDANALRARFNSAFPNLKSYLNYDAPYYKIRVGDYLTKMESQKDLNEIRKAYSGAYLVPCHIQINETIKKEE